ncbi:MAG: hypothetical protein AB7F64_04705 [Gammaproteobacteria bacterium]
MLIVKETEMKLVKNPRIKTFAHFKSQPQKQPYEVTQLAFDVEKETVIITLDSEKNRDSLLHALDFCKFTSGSGFKAPNFNVSARAVNQIVCIGPIDALLEFLELNESLSQTTLAACPVKPRISIVPE